MKNKIKKLLVKLNKPIINWSVGVFLGTLIFLFLLNFFFITYYKDKIYQGVYINNLTVGGLTKKEALDTVENQVNWESYPVVIQHQNQEIKTSTTQLQQEVNVSEVVQQAIEIGKTQNPINNIKDIIKTKFNKTHLQTKTSYNKQLLVDLLDSFKQQIDTPNKFPSLSLNVSGDGESLSFQQGVIGQELNVLVSADKMIDDLNSLNLSINHLKKDQDSIKLKAIIQKTSYQLTDSQILQAKERAKHYVGESILIKVEDSSSLIKDQELISLLALPTAYNEDKVKTLILNLATQFDRPSKDAIFNYDPNTLIVAEFVPHRDGLTIDLKNTALKIKRVMGKIEQSINEPKEWELVLNAVKASPQTTLSKSNNLGINEKIGFGESYFRHSASSRMHNIQTASTKLNNAIVKPGEEFSLNNHLGEVSIKTGYKQAYVIRSNSTVLAPGGGVCQVSTTLFRTLLDTGLNVTRRLPHSYRVRYYELNNDPGFDATVYSGETDLRFINDTDHNVLIHTIMDRENYHLVMEIYGTSDERTTEVSEYKKWGYASPPPPVYIPTDTLAPGQIKQIDWPVSGLKTSFRHIIKDANGNEMSNKVYHSTYRAWSAKYLVGQ